jgi:hypothetical protein
VSSNLQIILHLFNSTARKVAQSGGVKVTAWGLIGRRRAGKRLKKHAPIRPTALTR